MVRLRSSWHSLVPTDLCEDRHILEPAQLLYNFRGRELQAVIVHIAGEMVKGEPAGSILVYLNAFDSDSEAMRKKLVIKSNIDEMPVLA